MHICQSRFICSWQHIRFCDESHWGPFLQNVVFGCGGADPVHLPVSVYLLMTAHLLPQTAHHFSTSTPTLLNIIISCSFSIHTFPVFFIVEPLCLWNMVTVTSLKNDIIVAKRHTPRIKKLPYHTFLTIFFAFDIFMHVAKPALPLELWAASMWPPI